MSACGCVCGVVCVFPLQVVVSTCLCSGVVSPSCAQGRFWRCAGGWRAVKRAAGMARFVLHSSILRSFSSHFFLFPFVFALFYVTPGFMLNHLSASVSFFLSARSSGLLSLSLSLSPSLISVSLSFSPHPPVIPSPQAFPSLAQQSKQPPRKQRHNHNEHVEFS